MLVLIDLENYCNNICKSNKNECNRAKCPLWNAPAVDVKELAYGPRKKSEINRDELIKAIDHCRTCKDCKYCPVEPKDAQKGTLGCFWEILTRCREYIEYQEKEWDRSVYRGVSKLIAQATKIEMLKKEIANLKSSTIDVDDNK